MSKERMDFIPAMQDMIKSSLKAQGLDDEIVTESLRKWQAGEEATTPWEVGCFNVFEKVQADIEGPEAEAGGQA